MKPFFSLRWRLAIGAVMWTLGLFIVAGVCLTFAMIHHSSVPFTIPMIGASPAGGAML